MKKLLKISFCFLLVIAFWGGWTLSINAQTVKQYRQIEKTDLSKKERRKLSPKYIGIHIGANNIKFRDLATSPLFYNGPAIYWGLSRLKADQYKESEVALTYSAGNPKTGFNENWTFSKFKRLEIYYSQLYRFGDWNSAHFNTKVGWMLNATGNFRLNTELQNNALGLEVFPTLFLSFKLTKDISRTEEKNKQFLFFKYQLKEKQRNLSLRLNIGLLNASYRNGYVYFEQSVVLNDYQVFEDHEFKVFSGFRASTGLDYTKYLKNRNAIQISYIWDAYYTGGDLDKFEMANHILKFTLLFKTNNQ